MPVRTSIFCNLVHQNLQSITFSCFVLLNWVVNLFASFTFEFHHGSKSIMDKIFLLVAVESMGNDKHMVVV